MTFWVMVIVVAGAVGLFIGVRSTLRVKLRVKARPGFVYFMSAVGGDKHVPPAPIKVGYSHWDPSKYRLKQIQRYSPDKLEILHVIPTQVPGLLEMAIHRELAGYRRHGEWFDRDATLAWLDNYKSTRGRKHQ